MFARDLKSPPATTTVAVKKQEGTGKVCTVLYMLIGTRLGSSKHVTFVNSHRANVDDVTCDDIMCCKSCIIFCDSSHHFNQISVSLFVCWFYFSEQRKSSKNCSDEFTSDKFTSLISLWVHQSVSTKPLLSWSGFLCAWVASFTCTVCKPKHLSLSYCFYMWLRSPCTPLVGRRFCLWYICDPAWENPA